MLAMLSPFLLLMLRRFPTLEASTTDLDISIKQVKTTINISTPIILIDHSLHLTSPQPVSWFYFTVDELAAKRIAHIESYSENDDLELEILPVATLDKLWGKQNISAWKIHLTEKVRSHKSCEVSVRLHMTNVLEPFPKTLTQDEKQLTIYSGNVLLYSPYKVMAQEVVIKMRKNVDIHSYDKINNGTERRGDTVRYGPFIDVPPFSNSQINLHFVHNGPLLVAAKLEREVTVSHWGRISVFDQVQIQNKGASLKGEFSRLRSNFNAAKELVSFLPATALDIYYKDEIGLISSYKIENILDDTIAVRLSPRFPLLGGWKTNYELGYSVPAYEYLRHDGRTYTLTMPILDPIFDNMVVEDFILKIILPEGSQYIDAATPMGLKKLGEEHVYSLLDTSGRTTCVFAKTNVIEAGITDVQVRYTINPMEMIRKPFVLSSALCAIFFIYIVSKRINFFQI